jgi:hypothetical protein
MESILWEGVEPQYGDFDRAAQMARANVAHE